MQYFIYLQLFLVTYIARKYFKELAEKKEKNLVINILAFKMKLFSNNIGIKSFQLENMANDKYMNFIEKEFSLLKKIYILRKYHTIS